MASGSAIGKRNGKVGISIRTPSSNGEELVGMQTNCAPEKKRGKFDDE